MDRNSKLGAAMLVGGVALTCMLSPPAAADTILFDRGLPTANLNDAAGTLRSNVSWAEGSSGEKSPAVVSFGENFTLTTMSVIDSITVWVIDDGTAGTPAAGSYQLSLGPDAAPGPTSAAVVSPVASNASATSVTYNNDGITKYQGNSGGFDNIYAIDFTGLNLTKAAGTYAFGVSGLTDTGALTPFLSASNTADGGANQIGGTGVLYAFDSTGAMDNANGYPYQTPDGTWDKSSNIDVLVEGTQIPEPASLAMLGVGLAGLGALRRRKRA